MPSNTSSTCHVTQDRDAGADAAWHTLVRMCRSVALTTWSAVLTLLLAAPLRCASLFGPAWCLCLNLYLRYAFLGEANLLGGSVREVELPAFHIWTTVINLHSD